MVCLVLAGCDAFGFRDILDRGSTEAGLEIVPEEVFLTVGKTFTFSACGGLAPATYRILSGKGSIEESTGLYAAPGVPYNDVIRLTDANGDEEYGVAVVFEPFAIDPASLSLTVGDSTSFSVAGGISPYTFSIASGAGTIDSESGVYTAQEEGTGLVRATDSVGNCSEAEVQVSAAGSLTINPPSVTVCPGETVSFQTAGGSPPCTFAAVYGTITATADPSIVDYTAPGTEGQDQVTVTDSVLASATAAVTVTALDPLEISPTSVGLSINQQVTFSAFGGLTPYTFSVAFGSGTIEPDTGVYTAPARRGKETVRVTDQRGSTCDASVTVW